MTQQSADTDLTLASVGIDIGKDVFHIVGFDRDGRVALRRKIKRLSLVAEFKKLPPSIVGMDACLSAHFVSRTLRRLGHKPRIIPAIYIRPFLKGQKNDYNDAEAIAEAALRPNLRSVTEKTQDQLDLQALHRVRSRLVSRRTATINQIRAFLIEQGAVRSPGRVDVGPAGGDFRSVVSDFQVVEHILGGLVDACYEVAKLVEPMQFLIGLPGLTWSGLR